MGKSPARIKGARGAVTVSKKLPREMLEDIWKRTGLSGVEVAKRAGYATPSGFYALMQEQKQGSRKIPHQAIKRLIPVFRGMGNPPIEIDELLAISDAAPSSEPINRAMVRVASRATDHLALVNETGGDLLPIRLRAEASVYIDSDAPAKSYGVSVIGVSPEYPEKSQSVVLVLDDHGAPAFRRGTQLHVVSREQFTDKALEGRHVVVLADPRQGLAKVLVARVERAEASGEPVISTMTGDRLEGKIVGVVVGAYVRF